MKALIERRKHNRFRVPHGAYVALGSYFTKLGQIIDVSMSGLAFRYIGSEELSSLRTKSRIFIDSVVCLHEVPFETVSDLESSQIPFTSLVMRRNGVQFGELTHHQKSDLRHFIQCHTTADPEA